MSVIFFTSHGHGFSIYNQSTIATFVFKELPFFVIKGSLSELKLIEIVILWVRCSIPFGFGLFWRFWGEAIRLFKLLCLVKVH